MAVKEARWEVCTCTHASHNRKHVRHDGRLLPPEDVDSRRHRSGQRSGQLLSTLQTTQIIDRSSACSEIGLDPPEQQRMGLVCTSRPAKLHPFSTEKQRRMRKLHCYTYYILTLTPSVSFCTVQSLQKLLSTSGFLLIVLISDILLHYNLKNKDKQNSQKALFFMSEPANLVTMLPQ